jgi:DNA-binding winged helix-turn-helix (wHTH) protein/tetratricopeptide (TPR) repeat protein
MDVSLNETGVYLFGPFRLDPVRRSLTRNGATVLLTSRLFDLLLCLVQHADRVVTKDELLGTVWRDRIVEENNLPQSISVLRKTLLLDGQGERVIATITGHGYRLALPVRLESELVAPAIMSLSVEIGAGAAPAAASPDIAGLDVAARRPPRSFLSWAAAGLGLVALAVASGGLTWHFATPSAGPAPQHPLVVLTWAENLTADPAFDRVLGRALAIDLGQSPYLNLVSDAQVADTLSLMTRPKDTKLTPELAREVCARANGDYAVDATIAVLGTQYLLTLTATDCAGGRIEAQEKMQADGKDAIIPALDTLAGRLRGRLGETASSLARFGAPLLPEKTASFDALRAYSDGAFLVTQGRRVEAITLFQHAIELDPNFAMAYAALATMQANTHQDDLAAGSISKAYALRGLLNEHQKLSLNAKYEWFYRRDMPAALRAYRLLAETYPQDGSAWANVANTEDWIGQFQPAIEAAERAVQTEPRVESAYVVLARAYMHANEFAKARATCERAIASGIAGDDLREVLLEVAWGLHDQGLLQQQLDWARGKPGERILIVRMAIIAYSQGRLRDGDALFERAASLGQQAGLPDFTLAPRARNLFEVGEIDKARAFLDRVPGRRPTADYQFTTASTMQSLAESRPSDSMQNEMYAAQDRAAMALRHGRTAEAVAALSPALVYEAHEYDVPYLLGRIYLAAGDGPNAAAAFRKILDNPGIGATLPEYNLAYLGLARALRLGHDVAGSMRAYAAFLAAWRDADSDIPILQQARSEWAALRVEAASKK